MVSKVGLAKEEAKAHGYRLGEIIGMGVFSHVHIGLIRKDKDPQQQLMEDRKYCALKVMDQRRVTAVFREKFLPREIVALQMTRGHPNVVKFLDCFETSHHVYIVTEYYSGGTLLNYINSCYDEMQSGVTEIDAQHIFRQICLGLRYCHSRGIAHRDLKCENILLDQENNVKISDFGFAYIMSASYHREELQTSCGSYMYSAPEVLMGFSYDGFLADIWSTGVILFAIVNGKLPYSEDKLKEVTESMRFQRLKFRKHALPNAVRLVKRILEWDPESRPSLAQVLQYPFMKNTSTPSESAPRHSVKSFPAMSSSFNLAEQNRSASVKISEATGEIIKLKSRVPSLKIERMLGSYSQRPLLGHRRSSHFISPPISLPVEHPTIRRATLLDELEARLKRKRLPVAKPELHMAPLRRDPFFDNVPFMGELPFIAFEGDTADPSRQHSDTEATSSDDGNRKKDAVVEDNTKQAGGVQGTDSVDNILVAETGQTEGDACEDTGDVGEEHQAEDLTKTDAADKNVTSEVLIPSVVVIDWDEVTTKDLEFVAMTTFSSLSLNSVNRADPLSATDVSCEVTADPLNVNCDNADDNGDKVDASSPSPPKDDNCRLKMPVVNSEARSKLPSAVLTKTKVSVTKRTRGVQSGQTDLYGLHESLQINAVPRATRRSLGGANDRVLPLSLLGSRRASAPPKYIVPSAPRHKRCTPSHEETPPGSQAARPTHDLTADLTTEGLPPTQSPNKSHARPHINSRRRRHTQCEDTKSPRKLSNSELSSQHTFLNTSSNALSCDVNVSSAEEMDEDGDTRMEAVAWYTSYYRRVLGARQSVAWKRSTPPPVARPVRVSAVVALNAADNRQVSAFTTDEVRSFLRATFVRRSARLMQTANKPLSTSDFRPSVSQTDADGKQTTFYERLSSGGHPN